MKKTEQKEKSFEQVRQECIGKTAKEILEEVDKYNFETKNKQIELNNSARNDLNYAYMGFTATMACAAASVLARTGANEIFIGVTSVGLLGCIAGNAYILARSLMRSQEIKPYLKTNQENIYKCQVADEFHEYEKEFWDFYCTDRELRRLYSLSNRSRVENDYGYSEYVKLRAEGKSKEETYNIFIDNINTIIQERLQNTENIENLKQNKTEQIKEIELVKE